MSNMQKILQQAQEETKKLQKNCDPNDFWMQGQLRVMLWNLKKFEKFVTSYEKVISYLNNRNKQRD